MNRRLLLSSMAAAGLVSAGLLTTRGDAQTPAAVVGKPAPDLAVADSQGRVRTMAEFRGKPVVLEWTSPSCPFVAAHYQSGNMQALQRWATERGAVWLSVLSTHPKRGDYLARRHGSSIFVA